MKILCRLFEHIRAPRAGIGSGALLLLVIATRAAYPLSEITDTDTTGPLSRHSELEARQRPAIPSLTWKPAGQTPVWKTITLGTHASVNALLEALDSDTCGSSGPLVAQNTGSPRAYRSILRHAPRCRLGRSAGEIISRPAFHLSRTRQELDLVALAATELGFPADAEVSKEGIYDRAVLLGFALCPAEVGPQLRLQYLDQPIGEFLQIAMEPVRTYAGEPIDLTVANGGAGLLLVGGDGRPDATLSAVSRFVFVRPRPEP